MGGIEIWYTDTIGSLYKANGSRVLDIAGNTGKW